MGTASWSRPPWRRLSPQVTRKNAVTAQQCLTEAVRTEQWDTCHTCTVLCLVQTPHLTEEDTETDGEGGIWSVMWVPWPPVLFLTSSPCHGQIKCFPFILVDCTKLTRKASCNEVPAWFSFPWRGQTGRACGAHTWFYKRLLWSLGLQKIMP